MKTIIAQGTITAQTPISYSVPDTEGQLPRLAGRLYLTASSIRSLVRHAATEHLIDLINKKPYLLDYYLLSFGGTLSAGTEADGRILSRLRVAREKNPVVSLFGSMRHGVAGALYCGHALADAQVAQNMVSYVRSDDFRRNPQILDRLDTSALDDYLRQKSAADDRSNLKERKRELAAAQRKARNAGDDQALEVIQAQRQEVEEALNATKEVQQQQLPKYPCIPQGTTFEHEFVLENVSDLEIALFVQALDRLALSPYIGGKRAHGLGRFSAEWSVRGREKGQRAFAPMGTLIIDGRLNPMGATGEMASFLDMELLAKPLREGKLDLTEEGLSTLEKQAA